MSEKIATIIDPIAVADRLRSSAQEMREENYHDWAFLNEVAADVIVSMVHQRPKDKGPAQ